ncbi:MAG: hypothetical protein IPF79_06185 [Ignavibacteria bacterium]|nr:hypothetical protein [Ignavibacteria bacterium]
MAASTQPSSIRLYSAGMERSVLACGRFTSPSVEIHLRHRTYPLIGNEVSDELGPFGCLLHVITRNNNGIYV